MPLQPTNLPEWSSSTSTGVVEPISSQKGSGWHTSQQPPATYMNWLFNRLYQWILYLQAPWDFIVQKATLLGTSADLTPTFQAKDASGNRRLVVDRNGFLTTRMFEMRESWDRLWSNSGVATAAITGFIKWYYSGDNANSAASGSVVETGYNTRAIKISAGNGAKTWVSTSVDCVKLAAWMSVVMQWDMSMSTAGTGTNFDAYAGMGIGAFTIGGADSKMGFFKDSALANWLYFTTDGAGNTLADSGVAPVANTINRARVEWHGGTTPFGILAGNVPVVKFYIDDALVTSVTASIPVVGDIIRPVFAAAAIGVNSLKLYVGQMQLIANLQTSIDRV